jgi:hypothetical protein
MVEFRDSIVRPAGSSGVPSRLRRISIEAGVLLGADHREVEDPAQQWTDHANALVNALTGLRPTVGE